MSSSNSAPADRTLHRARIVVHREDLDALMEALAVLDPPPSAWEDMETGDAWVETYDADRAAVTARAREMERLVEAVDGRFHCASFAEVEPEDWREAWKKFFHTARVSRRVIVHPSWEPVDPQPGDVVVDIDPGMSFGTGLHPTTRSCIAFLDELADEFSASPEGFADATVLDLGCGSGILAIAALKLGFPGVTSLDFDPQCVKTAAENLALNGFPDAPVALGDVLKDPLPSARVVVANILAPVLIEAAPRIAVAVQKTPGATLLLSGILATQFDEVAAAYAAHGFALVRSLRDGEWTSGRFAR